MVEEYQPGSNLEAIGKVHLFDRIRRRREELGLRCLDEQKPLRLTTNDGRIPNPQKLHFELNPHRDADNAPSHDITEQLSFFSEEEQAVMFGNLVAIQLTHGCNGNCPWCVFGSKRGVTGKFSFDSIEELMRSRRDLLQGNPFLLYWDSDPFDYRDGSKTFLDVFLLYRKYFPQNSQYISTALPLGGEGDFIKFLHYLYSASLDIGNRNEQKTPVRISLTRQNIQRVEATLSILTGQLVAEGDKPGEVERFLDEHLTVVERFGDHLLPIGPLIGRADDVRDTFSVACRDGVVISPSSNEAIMVTAATKFEPSGQKTIPLKPGKVLSVVPLKVRDELYTRFIYGQAWLLERVESGRIMLPTIKRADGQELRLDDAVDDLTLRLGREIASMGRLMGNFSWFFPAKDREPQLVDAMIRFSEASIEDFVEREKHIHELIQEAQFFLQDKGFDDELVDLQIGRYLNVASIYLEKITFIIHRIKEGMSPEAISVLASIVSEVDGQEAKHLGKLLQTTGQLTDQQLSELWPISRLKARALIQEISLNT